MRNNDIVRFAREIREYWNTNDPYVIAGKYGIEVVFRNHCFTGFTAQTIKIEGYPAIISINNQYDIHTKKILCAHELGHALLHDNSINYFAGTSKNAVANTEGEANLFALALLSDDTINNCLAIPLENMNNYLLKTIVEFNINI